MVYKYQSYKGSWSGSSNGLQDLINKAYREDLESKLKELEVRKPEDTQIGGGHYKKKTIQPEAYSYANKLGWHEGEVVKYVTRWQEKGGKQDLEKAIHVLQLLLEKVK